MGTTNQIKAGALISYFAITFSIVAGILYTPWMIKTIGKSDYGLYILVTSFLSYFIMDFGLGQTIARYIAKYRTENNQEKINQLLGLTTKFYLFINALLCVVLIMLYFLIANIFVELEVAEIEKFKKVYIVAGAFSLFSFPFLTLDGVLIAYERFIVLKLCDAISKIGIVIFMVVALLLGYHLFALVVINAVVGLLIIIVKCVYLFKFTPVSVNLKYHDKSVLKELLKFSFWVFIIGIAQRLLINIAPTILGILSGTTQIALFSIGIIIEGYTWTFAHALNGLFMAKVTQLDTQKNNLHQVTNLMIRVGRVQLFLMGLLLIGLIVLGKDFIILWMGDDFKTSYYVAILLILPGFVTLTQEIGYTYLFVINELKYRAIMFVFASVVSVLISFVLAPEYGAVGCAIGIFTATMLCHVLGMNYVYWKVIKLEIPRFFKECYLSMVLPIVVTLFVGITVNYFISQISILIFIMKVIIISFIYLIMMWFFGLKTDEKLLFQNGITKLLQKLKLV
jgi:O-antigen/teichoic acid export membrane protein